MDSNWKLICPPCMPEKSSTERNGALSWIGSRIIWPCQNRAQEQFCCRCVGCLQLRAGGKSKKLQNLTGVTSNLDSFPFCLSTVNDNLLTWNKEWRNVKYDWQKYPCLLGMYIIFLIQPILEARAVIRKQFRWFFGGIEDTTISFQDFLTFKTDRLFLILLVNLSQEIKQTNKQSKDIYLI